MKLKTKERGANIENCVVCMICAFNINLTKIEGKLLDLVTYYSHHGWKWILEHHLICFEWMKYFCESSHSWLLFPKQPLFQSPIHDYETLSEDSRWLEISIIFVKKALHNFKTDELTWWNLICHVYKYCVCFFQGHLIIPKEGIENARVDPGGSK